MGRTGVEAHLVGLDQPDARVQADLTHECLSSVQLVLVAFRLGAAQMWHQEDSVLNMHASRSSETTKAGPKVQRLRGYTS